MSRNLKDRAGVEYVSLPLGKDDIAEFENVHALSVGADLYRIDNSPFYAYDLSYRDTVRAERSQGRLLFKETVARGGHSTYRVKLEEGNSHEDFLARFEALSALGVTFEGTSRSKRHLYAMDVPPEVDVQRVYDVLTRGEEDSFWEFEEAHFFRGHDT